MKQFCCYVSFFVFLIFFELYGTSHHPLRICTIDIGVQPPSFELGIDGSPAGAPEITPQHKIFPLQPVLSPMACSSGIVTDGQPSRGIVQVYHICFLIFIF